MPVLELTPDMVGPQRNRLTLAYIEGVMLWPGETDAGARARAYEAAEAVQFREHVSEVAAVVKEPVPLSLSDISAALWRAAEAPRIDAIQESTKKLFCHAHIAGEIFYRAIQDWHAGGKLGLQVVKQDVAARYRGKPGFGSLSLATVENSVWSVYKGVAHLWLAWRWVCEERLPRAPTFPCALEDLDQFLGTAESLRREAELCRGRQARPLQDPDRTWVVPEGLSLPQYQFAWAA